MYGLHSPINYGEQTSTYFTPVDCQSLLNPESFRPMFGSSDHNHSFYLSPSPSASASAAITISPVGIQGTSLDNGVDHIKARIASHPRYPSLLEAYIDCQKVLLFLCVAFLSFYVCN